MYEVPVVGDLSYWFSGQRAATPQQSKVVRTSVSRELRFEEYLLRHGRIALCVCACVVNENMITMQSVSTDSNYAPVYQYAGARDRDCLPINGRSQVTAIVTAHQCDKQEAHTLVDWEDPCRKQTTQIEHLKGTADPPRHTKGG